MTNDELMERVRLNEVKSLLSIANEDFELTIYSNNNSYELLNPPMKSVVIGGLNEVVAHIESELRFKGIKGNFRNEIKEILENKVIYA